MLRNSSITHHQDSNEMWIDSWRNVQVGTGDLENITNCVFHATRSLILIN